MECNFSKNCKKFATGQCELENTSFCVREFKIRTLLQQSLLTPEQMKDKGLMLFDRNVCDEEQYVKLSEYKKNIEEIVGSGRNLYIYSANTGNGKTSWAVKLLIAYIQKIWYKCTTDCHGLFINVPRFLLSLKSYISDKSDTYIPHIKENVLDADIVVWDDIATKCATEYEMENLLSIINSRMDAGKCNIFTSNVSPEFLPEFIGQRLASRLLQSEKIPFNGGDMRGVIIDTTECN